MKSLQYHFDFRFMSSISPPNKLLRKTTYEIRLAFILFNIRIIYLSQTKILQYFNNLFALFCRSQPKQLNIQSRGHVVGCPHGVLVKAMDYGIVVSEFVLESRYYIHFRANTLGKGMNRLILPAMG